MAVSAVTVAVAVVALPVRLGGAVPVAIAAAGAVVVMWGQRWPLPLALVAVMLANGEPIARWERRRLRLVHDGRLPPHHDQTSVEFRYAAACALALWPVDLVVVAAPFVPLGLGIYWLGSGGPVGGMTLVLTVVLPLLLGPYAFAGWAEVRSSVARASLFRADADLTGRLVEVTRSRARLVDAFEGERRRIERDLHDGAQQRLVALSMALGMARLDLPPDTPAAARVQAAQEQAMLALGELRELVRGVHPQLLADRGLPAAIADAAGRAPVPVEVEVALPRRLPTAVEAAAYFAVCEALANVAKHSRAGRASVRCRLDDDRLTVEVRDDGTGGADPAAGTGLTGLADRVAAVEGRLLLSSPAGGPTLVRVEIPCPTTVHSG
jgi:signal transduction histidine kinase